MKPRITIQASRYRKTSGELCWQAYVVGADDPSLVDCGVAGLPDDTREGIIAQAIDSTGHTPDELDVRITC